MIQWSAQLSGRVYIIIQIQDRAHNIAIAHQKDYGIAHVINDILERTLMIPPDRDIL
jgi:hypothetical protein